MDPVDWMLLEAEVEERAEGISEMSRINVMSGVKTLMNGVALWFILFPLGFILANRKRAYI